MGDPDTEGAAQLPNGFAGFGDGQVGLVRLNRFGSIEPSGQLIEVISSSI